MGLYLNQVPFILKTAQHVDTHDEFFRNPQSNGTFWRVTHFSFLFWSQQYNPFLRLLRGRDGMIYPSSCQFWQRCCCFSLWRPSLRSQTGTYWCAYFHSINHHYTSVSASIATWTINYFVILLEISRTVWDLRFKMWTPQLQHSCLALCNTHSTKIKTLPQTQKLLDLPIPEQPWRR